MKNCSVGMGHLECDRRKEEKKRSTSRCSTLLDSKKLNGLR